MGWRLWGTSVWGGQHEEARSSASCLCSGWVSPVRGPSADISPMKWLFEGDVEVARTAMVISFCSKHSSFLFLSKIPDSQTTRRLFSRSFSTWTRHLDPFGLGRGCIFKRPCTGRFECRRVFAFTALPSFLSQLRPSVPQYEIPTETKTRRFRFRIRVFIGSKV